MKSISCPSSLKIIDGGAFSYNDKLTNVKLNKGLQKINKYAFSYTGIKNIDIPDSVTTLGTYIFSGCKKLESVKMPENDKAKLSEGMFYHCKALKNVDITSGIKTIGESAFYGCENLKSIKLPDSVKKIEGFAFENCSSLEKIELPDTLNTIELYAFFSCKSLKDMKIPAGVKIIERYTFYGCSNLKNIVIPETITEIREYAFSYCSSLEKMTFNGKNTKMAQDAIGSYVDDNNKLEGIGNLVISCYEDSAVYDNYMEYYEDIENVSVEKIA